MRLPFLPPPDPGEFAVRKVHELVRDYPELIPTLEMSGVSFQRDGANSTVEGVVGNGDLEGLMAAVAWRGQSPA